MTSTELGPTRPDRLTIWPVEEGRFGIDVRWGGPAGHRRANVVHRQLKAAELASRLEDDGGYGWRVRVGPVPGDAVAQVIDAFIW